MFKVVNFLLIISLSVFTGFCLTGADRAESIDDGETMVYLQTDKGLYVSRDTLWLKGYILDAHSLQPAPKPEILYVRLISIEQDSTVSEFMIPAEGGFASGYIELHSEIPAGDYYLLGLSGRPFGVGHDRAFKSLRRIRILPISDGSTTPGIVPLSLPQHQEKARPDDTPFSVSFFAEGGHLVVGLPTVIAFHTHWHGKETLKKQVSGILYGNGEKIIRFSGNPRGYGRFEFTPQPEVAYSIQLDQPGGKVDFPTVHPEGITLRLSEHSFDTLHFSGEQTPDFVDTDQVYVSVQYRGQSIAAQRVPVRDGRYSFRLPVAMIPEGIVEVTLHDAHLTPLCERLVYINPQKKLHVEAELLDSIYSVGDKVKVMIRVRDEHGNPVHAHLGLSVWDSYYGNTDGLGIRAYSHLHTQLTSHIADADYYFREDPDRSEPDRFADLDLLLLTHGWRAYAWNKNRLKNDKVHDTVMPNGYGGSVQVPGNVAMPNALLSISPGGTMVSDPILVHENGSFQLHARDLYSGADNGYFYLRIISSEERRKRPKVTLNDPFTIVDSLMLNLEHPYFGNPLGMQKEPTSSRVEGVRILEEVLISANSRVIRHYRDPTTRRLDSLTKFSTDYVGLCNWLNCRDCAGGTKPIEGRIYPRYKDGRVPRHGRITGEVVLEPYKYPLYTEEQLLEMFNMYRAKGFQPERIFHDPSYSSLSDPSIRNDFRSTLLWRPIILTDAKGESIVEFHTSSITGLYKGRIEGVDADGRLGQAQFSFIVQEDN